MSQGPTKTFRISSLWFRPVLRGSFARPEPASRPIRPTARLFLAAAATLLVACAPDPAAFAQTIAATGAKPDFRLRDVNPNSPRNGREVSPRDYRLQISAYYFGSSG